jgi:hypothetical protein
MQGFYNLMKRGKICLKFLSKKITGGSVTVKDVTSKQIFSSPIKLAQHRLREELFEAGTYQISITNVTEGHIENIMIDESCTGLMKLLFVYILLRVFILLFF